MREGRITGIGCCCYHCMSRVVHGEFLLGSEEKACFHAIMRSAEEFCDVRILTYVIMDNHFHILLQVPEKETCISDEKLLRRVECLYGRKGAQRLESKLQSLESEGLTEQAEAERERYLVRMHDMGEFMKTLKQRFTQWYNNRHGVRGALWGDRYKSVLLERTGNVLETVAAYIDLNPVRAGLVADPKDYRYCGYAEAVAGDKRARRGLVGAASLAGSSASWSETARRYRINLYGIGGEAAFPRENLKRVLATDGRLTIRQLLRCRVRYFSDSLVLGTREFVERTGGYRSRLRKKFFQELKESSLSGLCGMRRLRGNPVALPIVQ